MKPTDDNDLLEAALGFAWMAYQRHLKQGEEAACAWIQAGFAGSRFCMFLTAEEKARLGARMLAVMAG